MRPLKMFERLKSLITVYLASISFFFFQGSVTLFLAFLGDLHDPSLLSFSPHPCLDGAPVPGLGDAHAHGKQHCPAIFYTRSVSFE